MVLQSRTRLSNWTEYFIIKSIYVFINFIEVWLIYGVMLISALLQWLSYTTILIYFFHIVSHCIYHRILNMIPVLYSRRLYLPPIYTSLHPLVPNSQSIPSHSLSPLAITSPFTVSNQYFRFHIYIYIYIYIYISYSTCLFLSKLVHLVW